jgi:biopolymer transport protein ExbB/TolQ
LRDSLPVEFVFQIFSLLIGFILVHAVYVAVIRPNADAFITEERAQLAADDDYIQQQSYYVILRDVEQETCLVLMFWALSILGYKGFSVYRQKQLLSQDLVGAAEPRIRPEETESIARNLENLPRAKREFLLPRVLLGALHRFTSTRNIQDASAVAQELCDHEADRLESELSTIRYIAWAIPSVGFIGTVRGIGAALAQAHRAVEGDITGVTESLGVAFNSTFTALVLSIILMFVIHQIQLMQERLVLDSKDYCSTWLIRKLDGGNTTPSTAT